MPVEIIPTISTNYNKKIKYSPKTSAYLEKMSEYTQEQYSAVVDGLDAMVGITLIIIDSFFQTHT